MSKPENTSKTKTFSRRLFLETTALAGGGLIISYYIPAPMMNKAFAAPPPGAPLPKPNAFVQIAPDNTITIVINKLEMGQGVNTSMAQLIAEELECDWTKIRSVSASVDPAYNHTAFGMQMTGGSTALISSWEQHRKIGASLREMLKSAAATRWGLPIAQVNAQNGFVVSKKGKFSYGELAEEAGKLPLPEKPALKNEKDFKIIGKNVNRVDAADKSNGKAIFGIDVRIPGMLYAVVAKPPLEGAKIKSMDKKAATKVPGVVDVVEFYGRVAVLARNTHAAKVGRDALQVKWDNPTNGKFSSDGLMENFRAQAKEKGKIAKDTGGVDEAMKLAKKTVTAEYEFPYLAHAAMEPMNCTINYDGKKCEMWSGHQMPGVDQAVVAAALKLKPADVKVNVVYAGGSFGRRASKSSDYVLEAAELAKVVKKPLKVTWTREDDMRGGFYRPMNFHRVAMGFDDKNKLLAWDHKIVGQTVIGGSAFEGMMVKDGLEPTIFEGVADSHYQFPKFRCDQTRATSPVTTLWWRSVGHTHTAYVMETMIDELAEASGKDPLQLRKELLAKSERHMRVLNLLEKETGWGKKKAPKGRAWGLAIHESFSSVVGQVAEVSMVDGMPKIHKVWAAVDCGLVVNPDQAKTQVEGAIVYGLSAALHQHVQFKDGQALQGNFNDYPVMRMIDMPEVKVAFVQGGGSPTGLGEPGVPPAAPAVANAIYKLTKKRLRSLPFSKELKGLA